MFIDFLNVCNIEKFHNNKNIQLINSFPNKPLMQYKTFDIISNKSKSFIKHKSNFSNTKICKKSLVKPFTSSRIKHFKRFYNFKPNNSATGSNKNSSNYYCIGKFKLLFENIILDKHNLFKNRRGTKHKIHFMKIKTVSVSYVEDKHNWVLKLTCGLCFLHYDRQKDILSLLHSFTLFIQSFIQRWHVAIIIIGWCKFKIKLVSFLGAIKKTVGSFFSGLLFEIEILRAGVWKILKFLYIEGVYDYFV